MNSPYDEREAKIEAAWRAALEHEQAPPGFALRVEAKLKTKTTRVSGWSVLHPDRAWLRIAIAAVLLLAIIIPMGLRLLHQAQTDRQAQIAKGEAARDQVLLALRITGTQLRTIQQRTRFINASPLAGESQ